jgi:NADH-quinone oxidoreductase subunit I
MKHNGEQLSLIDILQTTLSGMKATGAEAAKPAVTEEYPAQRPELPWGAKSQLHVEIEDCISCFKCAVACPSDCIRIDVVRAPVGALTDTSDGHKRQFDVVRFDIDMGQCCYCGLCTGRSSWVPADAKDTREALSLAARSATCPTDCINFYPRFENGSSDPGNLVYHFAAFNFDEAKFIWNAMPPEKRRTTHPGKPDRDYARDGHAQDRLEHSGC